MLMSSSGGRNTEALQRNTLKPLGEIMRARSSGIQPNRLSVALFAALALPVAGTAFAQDAADQEEEQATAAQAQASEETTELDRVTRSAEHTSELQSLMRISYDAFCLKKKNPRYHDKLTTTHN